MKLFIRAALSGSLLFMLLCAGAMLIGRSNSVQPELFQYLKTCDGQPCYLGVVPGKTSWNDAVEIFENAHISFDPMTNFAFEPLGFRGNALILDTPGDEAVLDEVDLTMHSSSVTIGSLIDHFGLPCAVVVTPVPQIGLIFLGMSIIVNSNQFDTSQILQPTTLIQQINLFNRFQSCEQVFNSTTTVTFNHWKGFARYTN